MARAPLERKMQAEFDSILTAAQAGADWAWRKIYDDLYATVVGYFRVQGATDAEALASDVLLQLAKSVSSFSGSYDQFRSWVFTIAHNRLIDDRRRKGRRVTEVAPHAAYTEPVGGDVETEAMAQISNSWVSAALEILTPDQHARSSVFESSVDSPSDRSPRSPTSDPARSRRHSGGASSASPNGTTATRIQPTTRSVYQSDVRRSARYRIRVPARRGPVHALAGRPHRRCSSDGGIAGKLILGIHSRACSRGAGRVKRSVAPCPRTLSAELSAQMAPRPGFQFDGGARSPARLRSRCDRCRRGPGTCAGGRHGRDWMVGNRPSFTCAGSRWASRTRRAQRRSCRIRRTGECGSERQCRAKRGLQRTRPCRTTRQRRPKT